ncbi:opioid growth factor receptor-like protein 1 [Gigantopelta aegis]|uniref:opioid growth factor receptor-like protein 1 n=1 Tax=Gigantopelta aegis TaxID=1735272 RepID=UPI001B8893CE|nr:opioid growth factor receptor-like protein 1 [Gigantopelta aegis]
MGKKISKYKREQKARDVGGESPRPPLSPPRYAKRSDEDTEDYRLGYPGKCDVKKADKNIIFYQNKMKSIPDGDYIDNIHADWKGKYTLLETHQGYIHWLFPIRESASNWHAQELQLHEIQAIKEDPVAYGRVRTSYELMLDFFGIKLIDKHTGKLARADNWEERFENLNSTFHNYTRITRILKSLGELGYEHYQAPFVDFILDEAFKRKTLNGQVLKSCIDYWVGTVKNEKARRKLLKKSSRHNWDQN